MLFKMSHRRGLAPTTMLPGVVQAMKTDVSNARVAAFSKRLLQVAIEQASGAFAAGSLFILSELLKVRLKGGRVAVHPL
jgi:CBF/Mak21 family